MLFNYRADLKDGTSIAMPYLIINSGADTVHMSGVVVDARAHQREDLTAPVWTGDSVNLDY
jgi:hypothetical protein